MLTTEMAADNSSEHRSSGDVEAARKEATSTHEKHVPDNTDILRESWSKKALIIAFTGYVSYFPLLIPKLT